jgi:hypothetical protein
MDETYAMACMQMWCSSEGDCEGELVGERCLDVLRNGAHDGWKLTSHLIYLRGGNCFVYQRSLLITRPSLLESGVDAEISTLSYEYVPDNKP